MVTGFVCGGVEGVEMVGLTSLLKRIRHPLGASHPNVETIQGMDDLKRKTDFLRVFLASSNGHVDKVGIESVLYDIENEKGVLGRAVHIGDGSLLTALHVIRPVGLQLVQQLRQGQKEKYAKKFEVVEYDANNDVALLRMHDYENTEKPLIQLGNRVPQLGETVSEFVRVYGSMGSDYIFQFKWEDAYYSSDTYGLGRIILPANSHFLEKQGEVRYNRDNTPSNSTYRENCFYAPIPTLEGDSGSPIFLRVADDKYVFVGILSRSYGTRHPLRNKRGYFTGAVIVDRGPIERLILQYLSKSIQTPHLSVP